MKNKIIKIIIFSSLVFLISFGVSVASTELEVKSEIDRIFVYPDSALVERVTNLNLEKGSYKIIFPNIISEVDENSLRVSVSGEIPIRLFGAQVKKSI